MLRISIYLLFYFTVLTSLAQPPMDRPGSRLLWKISGKGLKSPSYLFGTMHVTDPRAFEFNDSVLFKLKECSALALEVHPDSMVQEVFRTGYSERSLENKFKRILNEEDYQYVDSLLKKRYETSLKKIKSPGMLRYMIDSKGKTANESEAKKTFLDMYLAGIARKEGKHILGLERAADQIALSDDPSREEVIEMVEQWIGEGSANTIISYQQLMNVYQFGEIHQIRAMMVRSMTKDRFRKLITDRNLIMAKGIMDFSANQSVFYAVGAGHLAGDDGIVRILQSSGYTVKPVVAQFTGAKPTLKETDDRPWVRTQLAEAGYSFAMPRKPFSYRVDSLLLNRLVYADLSDMIIYQAAHYTVDIPHLDSGQQLAYLEDQTRSRTDIKVNNIKQIKTRLYIGVEYTYWFNGKFYRALAVLRNNVIYLLEVGWDEQTAFSPDAEKFFESLQFQEIVPSEMKNFTSQQGAFAIDMTGQIFTVVFKSDKKTAASDEYLFMSQNIATGQVFYARYRDLPPGHVSGSDSAYLSSTADAMMKQMSATNSKQRFTFIDRFPAVEFSYSNPLTKDGSGCVVMRGNRQYILLTTHHREDSVKAKSFLRSLKLTPYAPAHLEEYELEGGILKVKLPDPFSVDTVGFEQTLLYSSLDKFSGVGLIIECRKLSRYEESETENDFFEKHEEADTVLSKKSIAGKDFLGRQTVSGFEGNSTIQKKRTELHGRWLLTLTAYVPPDDSLTATAKEFFESVHVNFPTDDWNLFTDKTNQLMVDLTGSNVPLQLEAVNSIARHPFKKEDLPVLYKTVRNMVAVDSEQYSNGYSYKARLLTVLRNRHDELTLDFLEGIYPSLSEKGGEQEAALGALASLRSKDALQSFMSKLKNAPPSAAYSSFTLLRAFRDSLELCNEIFPEIINLYDRFDFPSFIFTTARFALDSGALRPGVRAKTELAILGLAKKRTSPVVLPDAHEDDYYDKLAFYEQLVSVLGTIPFTDDVKTILLKLVKTDRPELMDDALVLLLKNNVKVTNAHLVAVARNPAMRMLLYRQLREINKEKLFPMEYLSDQMISESLMHEYFEYEDEIPEACDLLKIEQGMYREVKTTFYIYKYKYPDGEEWYLAIIGLNSKRTEIDQYELVIGNRDLFVTEQSLNKKTKKMLENAGATVNP